MADIRTLKLNLLADVDQFGRGLNTAGNEAKGFSSKISKYGKVAAGALLAAGAAAGALAIKLGVDGVRAVIEDEQSQKLLAKALQNTTNATDEQIASTEQYISKQQLAFGVADTKLRPALANLARATGDVGKAQQLTNLALDIAAATGKDLETVSLTLGKAYNGNIGALTKLGIPLDENIKKSGDFLLVQDELTRLFGGAAKANTETYAGQLAIVNERFGELKEGIGVKLLPVLKTLLEQVNLVAKGFSGEDPDGLSARARELSGTMGGGGAYSLGASLNKVAEAFGYMFTELSSPDAVDGLSILERMARSLETFANAITNVTNAFKTYKRFYDSVPQGLRDFMNPFSRLGDYMQFAGRATGGTVTAGQPYRVGEFGSEIFVPNGSGSIRPDRGNGGGNTFILNGIVDAESARRTIERVMQNSTLRTGAVNLAGSPL